ncbi:hypothetical protein [Halorhodospira neutriphila]|nr:hypothetical protein [Halorhodospira neutriphila]
MRTRFDDHGNGFELWGDGSPDGLLQAWYCAACQARVSDPEEGCKSCGAPGVAGPTRPAADTKRGYGVAARLVHARSRQGQARAGGGRTANTRALMRLEDDIYVILSQPSIEEACQAAQALAAGAEADAEAAQATKEHQR